MRLPRAFILFVLFASLAPLRAQNSPCDQGATVPERNPTGRMPDILGPQSPDTSVTAEMKKKQMEDRNKDRQSSLKKDTDQLLQLATQLKQSVDKTNEHMLSLEVIKKTEQVEKLAKSIREKMKANGYCDFSIGQ